MTFRARLLLAGLVLALVPLAILGLGLRGRVIAALEAQFAGRVAALADVIEEDLQRESAALATRLERLAEEAAADPRLRLALVGGGAPDAEARPYLLDYASRAMPPTGLDLLRIQDAAGRVLSSGHFRAEYDASDPALPAALARAGERAVLAEVPTASGPMLALARAHTWTVGSETFTLVGGTAVDDRFLDRLGRGAGLDVRLVKPGEGDAMLGGPPAGSENPSAVAPSALVREVSVPFVGAAVGALSGDDGPPATGPRDAGPPDAAPATAVARFIVSASDAPLVRMRREMDRWLLAASAGAAVLALLLAAVVSAQLSRPLAALARRAGRIDLDRLDVAFPTRRLDEIGALSRVLDRMTGRLRASAARLREAERRATTGEIARQVHHDVKNGLIPIRNVLGHLGELAREQPDELPRVFLERQGTLDSGVSYLQSLASNYARLAPSLERRPCDPNRIAREVVGDAGASGNGDGSTGARVETDLAAGLPPVYADPVALRRILENLIVNAVESLEGGRGRVLVWTRRVDAGGGPPRVHLGVSDTGRGMTPEARARVFDDFFTTKPHGTGLGLSIVRRLVGDLGGSVHVESAPGEGTRFTIELPSAPSSGPTARADRTPDTAGSSAPHPPDRRP